MAKYMHLYTEIPAPELIATIERGIGRFQFVLSEQSSLGPIYCWDKGRVAVYSLNDEQKEIAREDCNIRNPLSKLSLYPIPSDEGSLDIYQMTAIALNDWNGDIALLNWGETVEVERVGGKITLNKASLPEEGLVIINHILGLKHAQ